MGPPSGRSVELSRGKAACEASAVAHSISAAQSLILIVRLPGIRPARKNIVTAVEAGWAGTVATCGGYRRASGWSWSSRG